jgi:hypothetical protein
MERTVVRQKRPALYHEQARDGTLYVGVAGNVPMQRRRTIGTRSSAKKPIRTRPSAGPK